uniref:Cadherin domain-containing protein n=1 Tax=Anopheles dirus TaxID=7168 RepID=A0A182NLH4_9DIPT
MFAPPWTPESPHYRYQVVEEQPIGTILTTVQATDADSTIAEYRMTENGFFEIHNTTAAAASKLRGMGTGPPDAEVFRVPRSNCGFLRPSQVMATDPDEGAAGDVKYAILSDNVGGIFRLDANSGILYPGASLIGKSGQYRIDIEARDGLGSGPHSDAATIVIEIQSINQHRPVFIMPALYNATVEIPENLATPDYLVMTVKATDNDSGTNGKVLYYLQVNSVNVQETDEFSINEMSGELRIRRQLDRKRQSRYELILVARDQGTPAWFETLRFLTVLLVDVNENYPEFPDASNPYKFFITENGARDVRIGKIQAFLDSASPSIYYYMLLGNEDGAFYVDKTSGDLYTNRSVDREENDAYVLYVLASKQSDLYVSEHERALLSTEQLERNATVAKVWVHVLDVNDNAPVFRRDVYYAGISSKASINELVAIVNATDRDLGVNATLDLFIRGSYLYKYGATKPKGSIVPSPFSISKEGRVVTANYMAEYNQDRFELEIVAKEVESPEREAMARVHVWIFNPEQLVRMILSRPPSEVHQDRDEIVSELGNATQRLIIVDEIRYHVDSLGRIRMDWCDMYFHAVDMGTQMIVPVEEILREIDAKYDFLQDYNAGFSILNVVPAYATTAQDEFDLALAALIALLIVLFVGAVSFIVLCCCLKHWSISIPSETRRKDALIKKQIIEDLNTTENPLWIEQKLKLYEEQELTMQVFSEPEMSQQQSMNNSNSTNSSQDPSSQLSLTLGLDHHHPLHHQQAPHLPPQHRRDSYDMSQAGDNTYATIQPRNYGTSNLSTVLGSGALVPPGGLPSSGVTSTSGTSSSEVADYATLRNSRAPSQLFEFRGSTFQVQQPGGGSDQPDYVTELM